MKFLLITYISFITLQISSQNTILRGNIKDDSTNSPVKFANIYIDSKNGSVSDLNGNFVLKFDKKFSNTDTVNISCVGYEKIKLPLKALSLDSINEILLSPKVYNLSITNITSKKITAYQILQNACENIKSNYINEEKFYLCEYMEYQEDLIKNRGKHSLLINSRLLIHDPGYKKCKRVKFSSLKEEVYYVSFNKYLKGEIASSIYNISENPLNSLLRSNPIRYSSKLLKSSNKYIYEIKKVYIDSNIMQKVIEIVIYPIDSINNESITHVFITSKDYKIVKYSSVEKFRNKNDNKIGSYYETLVVYNLREDDKMELEYIHYSYGSTLSYKDSIDTAYNRKVFTKLNYIKEIQIDSEELDNFKKMKINESVHNRKSFSNDSLINNIDF